VQQKLASQSLYARKDGGHQQRVRHLEVKEPLRRIEDFTGHPGGRGAFRFGDEAKPFVNGAGRLRAGETVEIVTPRAGGYGPPADRHPAAVGCDLTDGRIDLATAEATYHKPQR